MINVKDFGATGDGVTDDTTSIQSAINNGNLIYFPSGTYNINNLIINSRNKTLFGDNYRSSKITVTTPFPEYGIHLGKNADYLTIENIQIQGSGNNLIQSKNDGDGAYQLKFSKVWFGPCATAIHFDDPSYWTNFTDCVFRECDIGVLSHGSQLMNAVTFSGCTFFHGKGDENWGAAVDITNSDGIAFQGCQVQNQGVKLTNCKGISIVGGYWEAYYKPAIEAINSQIYLAGIFAPSATQFNFDTSSINQMTGYFLRYIVTNNENSKTYTVYGSNDLIENIQRVKNLFPSKQLPKKQITALSGSKTGSAGKVTIGDNGIIHIKFEEGVNQTNSFVIENVNNVSVFVKYRCIKGKGSVRFWDAVSGYAHSIDSDDSTEWYNYHATTATTDAKKVLLTFSGYSLDTEIEIERIVVSNQKGFIKEIATVDYPVSQNQNTFEDDVHSPIVGDVEDNKMISILCTFIAIVAIFIVFFLNKNK